MSALELFEIQKTFSGERVLDRVSIGFERGKIHALLGENGAGKTTLVRIATGLIRPDGGRILRDGRAVVLRSVRDAERIGIGMVHQHFTLVGALTVADNLFLPRGPSWFTARKLQSKAHQILSRHGIDLDPATRVDDLSVGERQRIEVVRALERATSVLILDEPTAVLAPTEVEALFSHLERLRSLGLAIVLITHRLPEVRAVADHVTVLRAGRIVLSRPAPLVDDSVLATSLTGVSRVFPESGAVLPGAVLPLSASRVRVRALAGERFGPIDLDLPDGTITAIAGVAGNGQTELVETLVGLRRRSSGDMVIDADEIGFLSGDRHGTALALNLSVGENVLLKRPLLEGIWWPPRRVESLSRPLLERFRVLARSPAQPMGELSGGNQQKVIAARELSFRPPVVIAENPTRGLDLSATAQIREELRAAARRGAAVLLCSTDLDEVAELADRILVAERGRLHPTSRDLGEISRRMTGLDLASGAGS